jgi:hypothetical protein
VRYLAAIAAAAALLALAAGCGGGGSSTASDSGGGEAAEANAACAAANRKIAALQAPDDDAAVLEYLEQTEAAVEQLRVELAGLGGSAGIREYSKALATSVGVLNEMANAARSSNPDAVRELSQELVDLQVGKLAEAAGLTTCAEAPGAES